MDDDERQRRAASFEQVADEYASYQPSFPPEAVSWMVGDRPQRVLELGAGTGKLTARLVELGHDTVASDPSAAMLTKLAAEVPRARTTQAVAEAIPLGTSTVDVVVAAQCMHLVDHERALPEIARVLKPGGSLVMAWIRGDQKIPWVRKVYSLIGTTPTDADTYDPLAGSDVFEITEEKAVKHWQEFRRDTLVGFVASTSRVASLDPAAREEIYRNAEELYDSYGRGPDGLLMPWRTHCYRARVAGLSRAAADDEPTQRISTDDLDDGLLIDFS